MLDYESAKIIGLNACIDKLGRDFVFENRDFATSAFGESEYTSKDKNGLLILDSTSKFAYRVSCHVNLLEGIPMFIECVVPNNN